MEVKESDCLSGDDFRHRAMVGERPALADGTSRAAAAST
jgi:hypothetical protein